jgi:hypothetical protein
MVVVIKRKVIEEVALASHLRGYAYAVFIAGGNIFFTCSAVINN